MKYNCESCNYSTNDRTSWHKHKKTIKHTSIEKVKNIQKQDEEEKIKKDHELELLKAKLMNNKNCDESEKIKKDYEIELLKEKLKSLENQLTKTEKQLTETKQLYETQILKTEEQYKSHIETLKNENNFQKQIINSAGGLIQKSMNTLSFLLLNYSNAPCLTSLDDYSILSKNTEYLMKDLIFYYKKNKLDKYFGDFIVKHYKKDNPELQAMWNSDTERLNYFIKELMNNKEIVLKENDEGKKNDTQWTVDRKGLKMTKYIINPLLDYINKLNINYLNQKHKENEYLELREKEVVLKDMEIIACINCDIKNNSLSKNINKYIAPYFYLDKNKEKSVKKRV